MWLLIVKPMALINPKIPEIIPRLMRKSPNGPDIESNKLAVPVPNSPKELEAIPVLILKFCQVSKSFQVDQSPQPTEQFIIHCQSSVISSVKVVFE